MELDLRTTASLSIVDSMFLDDDEPRVRAAYNAGVERLVDDNRCEETDLLLGVTCRNPYVNDILPVMSKLSLLRHRLIKGDRFNSITVDNRHLVYPVLDLLKEFEQPECLVVDCSVSGEPFERVYKLFRTLYGCALGFIYSRVYKLKKEPEGPVVFIDTFLMDSSIDKEGVYNDRYYTGHDFYLDDQEKQQRWFAPSLSGVSRASDYKQLFSRLCKSDVNFFIEEAWLSVSDYVYSIYKSIAIPLKIKSVPKFDGHDLTSLIKYEARKEICDFSFVRALAKFRFIRNLKNADIVVDKAIDWHENQVIDRALNLGFRKYYPNTHVHGYQGFMVPDYYACAQHVEFEQKLNTLPHFLHVIGPYAHGLRNPVVPGVEIIKSCAFRFDHLHSLKKEQTKTEVIVFILPMILSECESLIDAAVSFIERYDGDFVLKMKRHPAYSKMQFFSKINRVLDPRLKFTEASTAELLITANLVVSSTSSAAVEAVAIGVPVAIIGNRGGVTMDPIPRSVPDRLHTVFYTGQQLIEFLLDVRNLNYQNTSVSSYFNPIDRGLTRNLFVLGGVKE